MNIKKGYTVAAVFSMLFLCNRAFSGQCVFVPQQFTSLSKQQVNVSPSGEFKNLVKDISNYYLFIPSNSYPVGVKHLELKFIYYLLQRRNLRYWNNAITSTAGGDFFNVFGVELFKGLPYDINLGFTYMKNFDFCDDVFQFHLQWAIIPGWESSYSFGINASFNTVSGNGLYFMYGSSINATISKKIGRLIPYVSIAMSFNKVFSISKYRKDLGNPFIFTGKGALGIEYKISVFQLGAQFSISNIISYIMYSGFYF